MVLRFQKTSRLLFIWTKKWNLFFKNFEDINIQLWKQLHLNMEHIYTKQRVPYIFCFFVKTWNLFRLHIIILLVITFNLIYKINGHLGRYCLQKFSLVAKFTKVSFGELLYLVLVEVDILMQILKKINSTSFVSRQRRNWNFFLLFLAVCAWL